MPYTFILNPTSEGYTSQLNLSAQGYQVLQGAQFPPPAPRVIWASSYETDGAISADESSYENRQITLPVYVTGSSVADKESKVNALYKYVAQFNREGGVLQMTTPNNAVLFFDLEREAQAETTTDIKNRAQVELRLTARPFARGAVQTFSADTETSLPVLVFTETGVNGDVPGLGKLLVEEVDAAAVDWQWVKWAIQSRYYSADADAALFYEAEGRTPLGGAATAVGAAGASGGGSNVVRQGTLLPEWQAMLSTQATGGGSHLEHIGDFEVIARVFVPTANTGAVSVRLDWAVGDFLRFTQNNAVEFAVDDPREGAYTLVNLGQAHVPKVAQGTQRWEGRITAQSTAAGDDLDVDCLMLFPVGEGGGEASAPVRFATPTSFSARSEFDTESGAITGDSAAVGGVWAGAGDADDFTVGSSVATRTATSDADNFTGRYAVSGVAGFAAQAVQIDFERSAVPTGSGANLFQGVLARYTDVNNWLKAAVSAVGDGTITTHSLIVRKRVAGTITDIATLPQITAPALATRYSLRLLVDAAGRWYLWFWPTSTSPGSPVMWGVDTALATGGALASGKPGFYDANTSATAITRTYDNFLAFVPVTDAAVFSGQSLEVRHDRVIREDATGAVWAPVSRYDGSYLRVPPAGREARTIRVIVKASRFNPDTMTDPAIDDIRGTLSVTPRYLSIPEA